MDKLDKAIANLVASQVKFEGTLNELTKAVHWLSIISLTYYIVTVLVVTAYLL